MHPSEALEMLIAAHVLAHFVHCMAFDDPEHAKGYVRASVAAVVGGEPVFKARTECWLCER